MKDYSYLVEYEKYKYGGNDSKESYLKIILDNYLTIINSLENKNYIPIKEDYNFYMPILMENYSYLRNRKNDNNWFKEMTSLILLYERKLKILKIKNIP